MALMPRQLLPGSEDLTGDGTVVKCITVSGSSGTPTTGPPPAGSVVKVRFVGRAVDTPDYTSGTVFDSSAQRMERDVPFRANLGSGAFIRGLELALGGMARGETALLACAAEHAYSAKGAPPEVAPGATVVYEVTLCSFRPPLVAPGAPLTPESRMAGAARLKAVGPNASLIWLVPSVKADVPHSLPRPSVKGRGATFHSGAHRCGASAGTMQPASGRPKTERTLHVHSTGASFYSEREWAEATEAYGEAATALQVNDLPVELRREALDLIIACWLNQAQCQLQLQAWTRVEELCDRVLEREPSHTKALYRRGAALMRQGQATRARADLRAAYRAVPTDRGVRQLLDECERTLQAEERQERAYALRMFAPSPQMAAVKRPAGRGARIGKMSVADEANEADGAGGAGEARATEWRHAVRYALSLRTPRGLVDRLLDFLPDRTGATFLLWAVAAPLALSVVGLAALSST